MENGIAGLNVEKRAEAEFQRLRLPNRERRNSFSMHSSIILILLIVVHFVLLNKTLRATNLTEDAVNYLQSRATVNEFGYTTAGTILPVGSFRARCAKNPELERKREAIRDAVKHAWDAYASDAWGYDELLPVTRQGHDTFATGLGTTIVDSLSTMFIMGGLDGRYERARDWVKDTLDFSKVGQVIVFETVIRILGGLLSMFHLSGDRMYLEKAEELGMRLSVSFDTPLGLPWPRCFLNETGRCDLHQTLGDSLYLAELGSLQLEYRALAHHSTNAAVRKMRAVSESVLEFVQTTKSAAVRLSGTYSTLLPFALSMRSGMWNTNMVTMGAPADSYFEYLIKLWIQGGRREPKYWERFVQVIDSMLDLVCYTSSKGVTIVRNILPRPEGRVEFEHRMDHFSCYIPGMIVLGMNGLSKNDSQRRTKWIWIAEELTETCYKMYSESPSGLSGEHIRLGEKDEWRMSGGYQLRPEAIEAFFYMYRYTKREKYRQYAWRVFEQIERHCRVKSGGYSAIRTARTRHPQQADVMHSFLISETFKYLYLIFGDDEDELPLDKWVFNTEAHPLLVSPGLTDDINDFTHVANTARTTQETLFEQFADDEYVDKFDRRKMSHDEL